MTQRTCTIGYIREDGDVAVLATLNNNDELLDDATFEDMLLTLVSCLAESTDEDIRAWAREDAPDYLFKGEYAPEDWVDVTPEY